MSCADLIEPSAFRRVERRGRLTHVCCECRGAIAVGERHEYTSGVWDHKPSVFRTCLPCVAMRAYVQQWLSEQPDLCSYVVFGEVVASCDEWLRWDTTSLFTCAPLDAEEARTQGRLIGLWFAWCESDYDERERRTKARVRDKSERQG